MDRAISLPDAVNHLHHVKDATKPATEYNEGFIDALDFCISYLLSLPSAQPELPNICDGCEVRFVHGCDTECKKDVLKKYSAQPEWEEMLVICDNCGHAIHVKRQ